VGAAHISNTLTLLHPLGHGAQVAGSDFHRLIFARCGVKDALFDQIHLPSAARGAQRVASGVTEDRFLAGFSADPCHKFRKGNGGLLGSQREFAMKRRRNVLVRFVIVVFFGILCVCLF
jgi:hypothetical protein